MSEKSESVWESAKNIPLQLDQAWGEVSEISFDPEIGKCKNIVVAGMGGSALGARVLVSLFRRDLYVPIEIVTDYMLPGYVNSDSLVLLSSYSGNTEETLSCLSDARERGAKIYGITTGGALVKNIGDEGSYYLIDPKHNPSGQPRMAIGYSFGALCGILSKNGYIKLSNEEIEASLLELKDLISLFERKNAESSAWEISEKLYNKVPVIVSSEHLYGATHVFKNQLNETAKSMSILFEIPELNHHLMEGLANPSIIKDSFIFLFIESNFYYDRVRKRYEITKEIVSKNGIEYFEYEAVSKSRLSQVFEILALGSFVQLFLGEKYGADPISIPWVDYFKEHLS